MLSKSDREEVGSFLEWYKSSEPTTRWVVLGYARAFPFEYVIACLIDSCILKRMGWNEREQKWIFSSSLTMVYCYQDSKFTHTHKIPRETYQQKVFSLWMEFCLQDAKHLPKTNKTTQQECCLLGIKLMEISRDTWLFGQSSFFPSIKQRGQHCVHTASLCLPGRQIIERAGLPIKTPGTFCSSP